MSAYVGDQSQAALLAGTQPDYKDWIKTYLPALAAIAPQGVPLPGPISSAAAGPAPIQLDPNDPHGLSKYLTSALAPQPGMVYGNVLPWAQGEPTLENPSAKSGFALPMAAREAMIDTAHLMESPAEGTMSPRDTMALASLGLPGLASADKNAAYSIMGPASATWDKYMEGRAATLEANSVHPDEIRKETGLFRGADGAWRAEISDAGAKLKLENLQNRSGPLLKDWYAIKPSTVFDENAPMGSRYVEQPPTKLGDILDHPELFKAYPGMADITVKSPMMPGALGSYMPGEMSYLPGEAAQAIEAGQTPSFGKMTLAANKPDDLLNTILHEAGHATQDIEGYARGSNYREHISPEENQLLGSARNYQIGLEKQLKEAGTSIQEVERAHRVLPDVDTAGAQSLRDNMILKGWYKPEELDRLAQVKQIAAPFMDQITQHHNNMQWVKAVRDDATAQYQRVSGEQEAEAITRRKDLTQDQLRINPMEQDMDMPYSKQSVIPNATPFGYEFIKHLTGAE